MNSTLIVREPGYAAKRFCEAGTLRQLRGSNAVHGRLVAREHRRADYCGVDQRTGMIQEPYLHDELRENVEARGLEVLPPSRGASPVYSQTIP